ncbi:MAG: hypothetical protein LBF16_01995 [Pseudomonadales bacterium]|nr:hypothetical protein [Pseudomonadales bacterium]
MASLGINERSPVFSVNTHVQYRGWIGAKGTTGESLRLEAIRVKQEGALNLCLRPYVSNIGWMATQCTNGRGNTITVGTTGRSLAIEALEMRLTEGSCKAVGGRVVLHANAHLAGIGWTPYQFVGCGQTLTLGTTGQRRRMEAFDAAIGI